MDFERFSRGYRPKNETVQQNSEGQERHINVELEAAFEEARHWQDFFGEVISGQLEETPLDRDVFVREFTSYVQWAVLHVPLLEKKLAQQLEIDPECGEYYQELTFHKIAPYLIGEWWALIEPRYTPTDKERADSQSWIAANAAEMVRERKKLEALPQQTATTAVRLRRINGALTELDTHIALLEVARTQDPTSDRTNLVVLPAPDRFENEQASRNVDALVINQPNRQVRGIQAKTRISDTSHYKWIEERSPINAYDTRYVTLVDGFTDLGNTMPKRLNPIHSRITIVPRPGLLSMDHLMRTDVKNMPEYGNPAVRMLHMQRKGIAREMSGNRKSYITQAANNVRGKIMHDLYKEMPVAQILDAESDDEQIAV